MSNDCNFLGLRLWDIKVGNPIASLSIIEGERPTLINGSARLYLLRLTVPYCGFASAAS